MGARLLYIVSAGHSGSTLLDLVAGSIPGGFSTGEVTYLPWQLSRREPGGPDASLQKICSCGAGFHECAAWTAILGEVGRRAGFDVYAEPFRFRMNLLQNERLRGGLLSKDRLLRALYAAACATPLAAPLSRAIDARCRGAVANNWLLFDVIAEIMARDFVVDSSKSELRLKLLQQARPKDTFAIVLFRDVRGVAWSRKKLGYDPVAAARGWVRQYNRIWRVLGPIPDLRLLCMTYERLVADPSAERRRIGAFMGIDAVPAEVVVDTSQCHLAAGNAMKNQGLLRIRADEAWREGLTPDELGRIARAESGLAPGWAPQLEQARRAPA